MPDDFPEKGEFIAPHIARKKPDCDKKPLIPDPCEVRPGRRKASITNFDCVATPDKIVCPDDLIAVYTPEEGEPPPVDIPPLSTPPPPSPPLVTPAPGFFNFEQTASCPSSYEEFEALSCFNNDTDNELGPDNGGNWPSLGSRVIVPENTFFSEVSQEDANTQAKQFACSHLECCHGNTEASGKCEDLLTITSINYLKSVGAWDEATGTSPLVKGDPVTVPADVYGSCGPSKALAEAEQSTQDELIRILQDTCYVCNIPLHCPCTNDEEPAEGYTAEGCLFQARIIEVEAEAVTQKAQAYLDSICNCFEIDDPPDFEDICPPKIILDIINPNEENPCGIEPGTETQEIESPLNEDCELELELEFPEVPCPCGITHTTIIQNPNLKPQDPGHDAAEHFFTDPGGTSGELVDTSQDDCAIVTTITLPEVPLGDFPVFWPPRAAGGGGGGGPCPEGYQVEFCVDGKKKRTKPKKKFNPNKVGSCEGCESWTGPGGFLEGDIVQETCPNPPYDQCCYKVLADQPSGGGPLTAGNYPRPGHEANWQTYYESVDYGCLEAHTDDPGAPGTPPEEQSDDECSCKTCLEWAANGDLSVGTVVSYFIGGDDDFSGDDVFWRCFEVVREIPNGEHFEPTQTPGWQNYYASTNITCADDSDPDGGQAHCEDTADREVEDVPVDEHGVPTENDYDPENDPCIIQIPCIDICSEIEVSNDAIEFASDLGSLGSISLKKLHNSSRPLGVGDCSSCPSWTGAGGFSIGEIVSEVCPTAPYGNCCYEVIQDVPESGLGQALSPGFDNGWQSYYRATTNGCNELGEPQTSDGLTSNDSACIIALDGPVIDIPVCEIVSASEKKISIKFNGKNQGELGLRKKGQAAEFQWTGAESYELGDMVFENGVCYEIIQNVAPMEPPGVPADEPDYYSPTECPACDRDCCQFELFPNDIDLQFSANDFCPETTDNKVRVTFNGKGGGYIGLNTTEDCQVALSDNDIDLQFSANDFCPEIDDANAYVTFTAGGEDLGEITLEKDDECRLQLVGNINIPLPNDSDSCPEIHESEYSIDLEDSDGDILGTIVLEKDENCKLKLTGGPIVIPTFNTCDTDFPYEEKEIEVCTESGTETYTILVKKSG